MPAMLKYALRYAPLLILALLLVPLRLYMAARSQQQATSPAYQATSPFSPGSALYSVTLLPSGDAWAVGGSFSFFKSGAPGTTQGFPVPDNGIILHYTTHAWVAGKVADPLRLPLLGVSLDSPQDGWAVGWGGTFVHYDGNEWTTAAGPANFNKNLLGVAMLTPANGWAVGYSGSILHYDGRQWTQVKSPTTLDLRSIAMPSAQEGWAVGSSGTILHYHNGTWSLVTPSPTNITLNGVAMLSTSEGWAVGEHGTILHYRDGTWESVHPANYYQNPALYQSGAFFSVAMNSIRSGWIAGEEHVLTYSTEAWVEPDNSISFSVNGKYMNTTLNNLSLYSIVLSPSGEGWAVGRINSIKSSAFTSESAAIFHYQGGKWFTSLVLD